MGSKTNDPWLGMDTKIIFRFFIFLSFFNFSKGNHDVVFSYDVLDPPEGAFSEHWMEIYINDDKVGYGGEP